MAAPGGFTKKAVDIEALMAQAAAAEEEEKAAAASKGSKKKKVKKEKVKKERVKKERPKKERKEKPKKEKKSGSKEKKSRKKSKKNKGDELEPREIFGVRLSELNIEEGDIPEVFAELITCLEGHATETQGLFRKTAPVSEVSALIDRYHAGEDLDWNDIEDKHLVAGVLMAFLLRLPEPLITFKAYDELINIASSDKEREEQLHAIKGVLKSLPELNFNMLEYLLDFLDTMTRDSDDNLMTSENLAICFGPGLLRREEENLGQLMKESSLVTSLLTVMVDQYGFFFRDEGIDEDQASTSIKRSNTDFSAFITVALTGLQDVSKQLSDIVGDLEWEKLWQPKTLGHLAVMEDILAKVLDDEISTVNEELINNEIADSLEYHLKDIQSESVGSYCKSIREKFVKHHSTVEDTIIVLNQQSGERDVVLQACKTSKCAAVLLRIMKPNIAKDLDVSSSDVKDVKSLVPNIKKELNQLKVQLDSCENYHFAAVLSRVIRAVQKGLKERIKTPISEVDLTVPTTAPAKSDKMKIENLQDALEFSFPACTKILTTILAELDDPEKKSEAMRSSDLLVEVAEILRKFKALGLSPKSSGAPPPTAAHPKEVKSSAPPPIAEHPKAKPAPVAAHPKASKPPPIASHPKSATKPQPVAAHPRSVGATNQRPAPVASHPKSQAGQRPPPMAAHPRAGGAPPPMAAHPRSGGANQRPAPVAAHPKSQAGQRPPPMAAHPHAGAPPPMAPHPSTRK